jgi:hypothetical protein
MVAEAGIVDMQSGSRGITSMSWQIYLQDAVSRAGRRPDCSDEKVEQNRSGKPGRRRMRWSRYGITKPRQRCFSLSGTGGARVWRSEEVASGFGWAWWCGLTNLQRRRMGF